MRNRRLVKPGLIYRAKREARVRKQEPFRRGPVVVLDRRE
jgi:hypothetical protein